ncbi:MAG: oxidoreductase [Halioglobus sp.]|nr:oxidoreductase [Halioglobus sp.]|tara:strand:+ start:695 stop:1747 length:1053 start_codon:yes stop_codon:yes gene_type:complete
MSSDPLVVCIGYPALQEARFVERLRAVDPRVEVITLPVDEGGDWLTMPPDRPHEEPPPWAAGFAAQRRAALARAEVLVQLHTPGRLMERAPHLRWLQGMGAGVDQFAAAGVSRDRVVVTNASGVSADSISEFVIARLLQVWKRLPEAEQYQRQHEYTRTYRRSFAGSVIGIVGLGAIGEAVAQRARALGCTVLATRRSAGRPGVDAGSAHELFTTAQLHEMLARCDAVVVSAPATPETHHLIDRAAFEAMKPATVLVNVARGSLVDESAIPGALASGQLAAAALDVFEVEPLPVESPLWDLDNVFISAHSSVSVDRYLDDVFDLFEDNLQRYVRGEPLRNRVDMQALGFA